MSLATCWCFWDVPITLEIVFSSHNQLETDKNIVLHLPFNEHAHVYSYTPVPLHKNTRHSSIRNHIGDNSAAATKLYIVYIYTHSRTWGSTSKWCQFFSLLLFFFQCHINCWLDTYYICKLKKKNIGKKKLVRRNTNTCTWFHRIYVCTYLCQTMRPVHSTHTTQTKVLNHLVRHFNGCIDFLLITSYS